MDVSRKAVLWSTSGVMGVSVVSVLTLASRTDLNRRLTFAAFCFAFAIPMLTVCIFLMESGQEEDARPGIAVVRHYFLGLFILGLAGALVGVGALLFHLGVWVGICFMLAIAAALFLGHLS